MHFIRSVLSGNIYLFIASSWLCLLHLMWLFGFSILILASQIYTAAAAKSLQSCPTLCDPIDGSPPGSPVPGILQASTLEWVAISFSNAWKWKVKVKLLSRVGLLVTPWTAAYQALLSMKFSRQEWGAIAFSDIHVNIRYLPFSFWLTSVCMIRIISSILQKRIVKVRGIKSIAIIFLLFPIL